MNALAYMRIKYYCLYEINTEIKLQRRNCYTGQSVGVNYWYFLKLILENTDVYDGK